MLLWPMHVFWLSLIAKMAVKVVFGKYQDVRSGDDDSDEDGGKSRTKKQSKQE
jgi:hypothetical protein